MAAERGAPGSPDETDLIVAAVRLLAQQHRGVDERLAAAERRNAELAQELAELKEQLARLRRQAATGRRPGGGEERLARLRELVQQLQEDAGQPAAEQPPPAEPKPAEPHQAEPLPHQPEPPPERGEPPPAIPTISERPAGQLLLRVEELSKRNRGDQGLVSVSFDVRQGEILGLVGPKGAGKTTLLAGLVGLVPTSGGRVLDADGTPLDGRRNALMFYLPDGLTPCGELVTADVLELFAELSAVEHQQWRRHVEQLELAPVLGKRVNTLSRWHQRRLLLALALLAPQPLLVLDEPFDGLDPQQARAAMAVLRELPAAGRTLLLASHQFAEAERICDRFVLLDAGRLVGVGSLPELRARAGLSAGSLEEAFLALA